MSASAGQNAFGTTYRESYISAPSTHIEIFDTTHLVQPFISNTSNRWSVVVRENRSTTWYYIPRFFSPSLFSVSLFLLGWYHFFFLWRIKCRCASAFVGIVLSCLFCVFSWFFPNKVHLLLILRPNTVHAETKRNAHGTRAVCVAMINHKQTFIVFAAEHWVCGLHKIYTVSFFPGHGNHGLHVDLPEVTRLCSFRTAGARRFSVLAPPRRRQLWSLLTILALHHYRSQGLCRAMHGATSTTRGEANGLPSVSTMSYFKQQSTTSSNHWMKYIEHRTPPRNKITCVSTRHARSEFMRVLY